MVTWPESAAKKRNSDNSIRSLLEDTLLEESTDFGDNNNMAPLKVSKQEIADIARYR